MSRKKFFWIPTLVVSVLGFSIVAMYAYLFTISRHQCFRSSPSPIAWLQQLTNRACGLSLPTRVADSWLSFSAIIVFNDSFLVFSPAPYLRAPPCYGSGEPMPDDATISNGQSPLDPDATLASVGPQAATVAAKVPSTIGRLKFVREQFFLAAVAQNIKRLVRFLSQPTTPVLTTTS